MEDKKTEKDKEKEVAPSKQFKRLKACKSFKFPAPINTIDEEINENDETKLPKIYSEKSMNLLTPQCKGLLITNNYLLFVIALDSHSSHIVNSNMTNIKKTYSLVSTCKGCKDKANTIKELNSIIEMKNEQLYQKEKFYNDQMRLRSNFSPDITGFKQKRDEELDNISEIEEKEKFGESEVKEIKDLKDENKVLHDKILEQSIVEELLKYEIYRLRRVIVENQLN